MVYKITSLVSKNKKSIARKAMVLGGMTIAYVGFMLTKEQNPDAVFVEETVETIKVTTEDTPES